MTNKLLPKKKRGRPSSTTPPLTGAERQRRYIQKLKTGSILNKPQINEAISSTTQTAASINSGHKRNSDDYYLRANLGAIKAFINGSESLAIAMKAYLKYPDEKEKLRQLKKLFAYHADHYQRAIKAMDSIVNSTKWSDDWQTAHAVEFLKSWNIFDHSKI